MDERTHFGSMQTFGWGVRAIVAAIQATGPAIILPKIGLGPITAPLPDLSEDEVRMEMWSRCEGHLQLMQEGIDFIGNRMSGDDE